MRIGISTFGLSSGLGMAGVGRYILGLAHGLVSVNRDHELVFFGNADNLHLLPAHGCERIDCGGLTTSRPLRLLWEQAVFPITLQRHRIDLLHSPVFVRPLAWRGASAVTIHDMTWWLLRDQHTVSKGLYFRTMIPPSARRATRIIAVSESAKQDTVTLLGIPEDRVAVTYEGVEPVFSVPQEDHNDAGITGKSRVAVPYVLYVGKIEPRKNLVVLIEAFDAIAGEFPEHQLILAGNRGWDCDPVVSAAGEARYAHRIHLTGFVPEAELPQLYAGADLFVYPSSYEGFGLPVLEAMACGTPVITSNVSSLPEVAGDAALLVNPGEVGTLAEAMRRVLGGPALAAQMRGRGLTQAARFTWEETARRTLHVYEEAYTAARREGRR